MTEINAELIDYFWSGKHKKVVKGINIVTLYYTDRNGVSVPANYRIVNKNERKTKHDYFLVIRSFILDNLAAQFLDLNNLEKIASF